MKARMLFMTVGLGALLFSCNNTATTSGDSTSQNTSGKIAYINVDTLMDQYLLAIDLNEELLKKQENVRADLNARGSEIEKMIQDFQYKIENRAFTTQKRAEDAQNKIVQKRNKFEEIKETLTQNLIQEQEKMQFRLHDSIANFLENYNKTANFDLILRTVKGGNVLYGKPSLNITKEVVEMLNKGYNSEDSDENLATKQDTTAAKE